MTLMKRRLKNELEESTNDFKAQIKKLDNKISKLKSVKAEVTEKFSEIHLFEEKLKEKLVVSKKRFL